MTDLEKLLGENVLYLLKRALLQVDSERPTYERILRKIEELERAIRELPAEDV